MSDTAPSLRVEIAIRAAMLAKAALEMVGMEPSLVRLQLNELAKQIHELDTAVAAGSAKRGNR